MVAVRTLVGVSKKLPEFAPSRWKIVICWDCCEMQWLCGTKNVCTMADKDVTFDLYERNSLIRGESNLTISNERPLNLISSEIQPVQVRPREIENLRSQVSANRYLRLARQGVKIDQELSRVNRESYLFLKKRYNLNLAVKRRWKFPQIDEAWGPRFQLLNKQ